MAVGPSNQTASVKDNARPVSLETPKFPNSPSDSDNEQGESETSTSPYDRFPAHRKTIMVVVISWCGLLSPISSTAVLSAIPNVAASFNTTGSMISLSNALYLCCLSTGLMYFLCSIATALAPNVAAFMVFRMLTAFCGTAFLVIGPAVIGDLFHPTERATALGWFYTGALIGPTIGPLLGGVIVTYTSWRVIFWMQTGLAATAMAGTVLFLSETLIVDKNSKKVVMAQLTTPMEKFKYLAKVTSPLRPLSLLLTSPNLVLVAFGSGSIVWNQYGLLTPIRYVLNPRFHLTSPAQSGLFYLAPGVGYVVGTLGGGRWADYVVKKWMTKRGGERVPEDRLRSCVTFLGAVLPGSILIYGWSVEKSVGGIPLPVVFMFVQGVAQSFCFPSLNTYCLDVVQARSAEAVAGNFMVRYLFGAVASAIVLPAVESIGVGWFCTISAALLILGGLGVYSVARWGGGWRERSESRSKTTTEASGASP
ncbi:hypothetical protein VMCG_10905 [Cytospora schulzeri]|uniref:Major facilitator superfamily (MFS) profile domain-containing protein n=1 Tax=Cytospora schulzeri TaxID=448051 RepID=A0A423V7X8_9PEZI|nr:hypothetical protein VMCG_10905 [Valsa malicola]